MRTAEREEMDAKDELFVRLSDVFGHSGFDRDVKLFGASNHRWRIDAAIIRSGTPAVLFNSVTPSYISAVGTAAKFNDLSRLEISPRRIAVATSFLSLKDWIGVVSSASDAVIEMKAANDQFSRLAAAA